MKALVVIVLAATVLAVSSAREAFAASDRPGGGDRAGAAPQAKGKPAPAPTKRKRTRTTIPPAKGKKGHPAAG